MAMKEFLERERVRHRSSSSPCSVFLLHFLYVCLFLSLPLLLFLSSPRLVLLLLVLFVFSSPLLLLLLLVLFLFPLCPLFSCGPLFSLPLLLPPYQSPYDLQCVYSDVIWCEAARSRRSVRCNEVPQIRMIPNTRK